MTVDEVNATARVCHYRAIAQFFNINLNTVMDEIYDMDDKEVVALALECGFSAMAFLANMEVK